MTTRWALAMVVALAAGAPSAHATCGWFGTQLECSLGSSEVVIGTQAADDPAHASSLRPWSFLGGSRLLDDASQSARPFKLGVQNFSNDPSRCRQIGNVNETYCY